MSICNTIFVIAGIWFGCGLSAVGIIMFVDTVLRGQRITNHYWDELGRVFLKGPVSLYWLYQLWWYLR